MNSPWRWGGRFGTPSMVVSLIGSVLGSNGWAWRLCEEVSINVWIIGHLKRQNIAKVVPYFLETTD
jgi:hypothetical protein